jgi:ribosome-associated toxin RatA of RatAB toxin-antitoxin module
MNQLQKSLLTNAIFSGLSGIVLVVFNKLIARLFDTANTVVFWIIGLALIFFAATIIYEMKRQKPIGVLLIIIQDFVWVIGSIVLLIFQPFEISITGNVIIALVAFVVLFMGINQAKALGQIDNKSTGTIKQLRFERKTKAAKAKVWEVISDVANYHEVAPNIDDVEIVSGQEEGMIRSCSHGKDSWTETCSLWREEKEYAFEVNTDAADYPYPFTYLKGNWKIEEINSSHTKIIMLFEFEYRKKFQNWLLHPILKIKFSKTAKALLDNWQKKIKKK